MYIFAVINNKGGVGKTTVAVNLALELSKSYRVLFVDADPQSNASIVLLGDDKLYDIWRNEFYYLHGGHFEQLDYDDECKKPRSLHFLLKPMQDGFNTCYNKPFVIRNNLSIIPSCLSLSDYEKPLLERYAGLFSGDGLSHHTFSGLYNTIKSHEKDFDIVIVDMSSSLGMLDKSIIMYCDGVIIPCQPNVFSMCGMRNTESKMAQWVDDYSKLNNLYNTLLKDRYHNLPTKTPKIIGYVVNYFGKDFESAQPHIAALSKETNRYSRVLKCQNIHEPLGGNFFGGNPQAELRSVDMVRDFTTWHNKDEPLPNMFEYKQLAMDMLGRIRN